MAAYLFVSILCLVLMGTSVHGDTNTRITSVDNQVSTGAVGLQGTPPYSKAIKKPTIEASQDESCDRNLTANCKKEVLDDVCYSIGDPVFTSVFCCKNLVGNVDEKCFYNVFTSIEVQATCKNDFEGDITGRAGEIWTTCKNEA